MFTDNAEAAYVQQRIDASCEMAFAAKSDCARLVHEALADQYRRKLSSLRRVPLPIRSAPIEARIQAIAMLVDN